MTDLVGNGGSIGRRLRCLWLLLAGCGGCLVSGGGSIALLAADLRWRCIVLAGGPSRGGGRAISHALAGRAALDDGEGQALVGGAHTVFVAGVEAKLGDDISGLLGADLDDDWLWSAAAALKACRAADLQHAYLCSMKSTTAIFVGCSRIVDISAPLLSEPGSPYA